MTSEEELAELAKAVLPFVDNIPLLIKENKDVRKRIKLQGCSLQTFQFLLQTAYVFPHIAALFQRYAKTDQDYLTVTEFRSFLNQQQGVRNPEATLRLYYAMSGGSMILSSRREAFEVFGEHLSVTREGTLLIFGFTSFVLSQQNDIFNMKHAQVYQNMTLPLSNYFIASSHNTYLEGDQLKSNSSCDAYRRVLQSGCRCIELDLWDGPKNDPIIYHGYTLTSKIRARDVLDTIAKHAFDASPYPLILSFENHLSLAQQQTMVQHIREAFAPGVVPNAENSKFWDADPHSLPSPEELKGKILIKNKAHPSRGYLATNKANKQHARIAQEMSDLVVYTKSARFPTLREALGSKCYEMMSLAEKKAMKAWRQSSNVFMQLNGARLLRTYPDGMRFDSSNYDPQPLWNMGTSMAALNYQKPDRAMQLSIGRFLQNGNCGYTLKPPVLQELATQGVAATPVTFFKLTTKILAGYNLHHPRNKRRLNPLVEVEVVGVEELSQVSAPAKLDRGNYVWDETFSFNVFVPEVALLRITVMDDKFGSKDIVGQFTLPLESLQQGYRPVRLVYPKPFEYMSHPHTSYILLHVNISGVSKRVLPEAGDVDTADSTIAVITSKNQKEDVRTAVDDEDRDYAEEKASALAKRPSTASLSVNAAAGSRRSSGPSSPLASPTGSSHASSRRPSVSQATGFADTAASFAETAESAIAASRAPSRRSSEGSMRKQSVGAQSPDMAELRANTAQRKESEQSQASMPSPAPVRKESEQSQASMPSPAPVRKQSEQSQASMPSPVPSRKESEQSAMSAPSRKESEQSAISVPSTSLAGEAASPATLSKKDAKKAAEEMKKAAKQAEKDAKEKAKQEEKAAKQAEKEAKEAAKAAEKAAKEAAKAAKKK